MQLVKDAPMTVKETIEFLKVSRAQLYKLERQGLPFGRLGKQKRYIKEQLIEYINKPK